MATTVTGTKTKDSKAIVQGPGLPGSNGKNGNGWRKNGDEDSGRKFSPETYRVTMWVILAAIIMMFVALSSAYIVLSGNDNWRPVRMPGMFFLSTGLILVSSGTMEAARRSLRPTGNQRSARWLTLTLVLGLVFLAAQLIGWRQLAVQGVYFTGQPHSSFYFLFTGLHGLHLIGGILALSYLVTRSLRNWQGTAAAKRKSLIESAALYWHVMDGLWIWLFLLLLVWR
jgi:cytochrome c oxidase subunit 3